MENHRKVLELIFCFICFVCGGCAAAQADSSSDDCSAVQCPKVKECPPDSYRLPAIIDSSHETCCPPIQSCHCNPGLLCLSPPKCPGGSLGKLITSLDLTGQPGHCCPTYECKQEDEGAQKVQTVCSFNGKMYDSGESWVHQAECSECNCYHGVVSCKPIQCDLHESCTLVRAEPGSCCPVCVGCVGNSGAVHNNSDVWDEDPCTTCECTEGRIKCHAAMCQTTCSNPTHIRGECCPRCNNGLECPIMDCHLECPNGFRLTKAGCPTCKCNKCRSLADCVKECQFGFETNEKGCPICHCRQFEVEEKEEEGLHGTRAHGIQVHQPALRVVSKSVADLGLKCDGTWDETLRLNGEEWSDSCRRCVCKNGSEMCSLITCPLPQCEHPFFYPESCCPRCPGDHVDLFEPENGSPVCQSSVGVAHVNGDTWKIGGCLTCTCHDGQVLCAGPDCPPTPCPHSRIQNEGDCCLTCPNNMSRTINDKNISSSQSKSYCFSDDSQKVYSDGEMWKVGPCQSCICQGGEVHCFSGGKCLTLECERPILAKNQCCPICLESETKKIVTSSSDLREGSDSGPQSQNAYLNGSVTTELSVKSPESLGPIISSSDLTTRTGDDMSSSGGLEPHCAIIITSLIGVSCLLILYIVRSCFFTRRVSLTKKLPFHSSNSSSGTSPPLTPDCCYKYTSCAQSSEQKTPLCHTNSTSRNTNPILNSGDKV